MFERPIDALVAAFARCVEIQVRPPDDEAALAAALSAIAVDLHHARTGRLGLLVDRLSLSVTEMHVLGVMAAREIDRDVQLRIAAFGGTVDPTLDTLRRLVYGEAASCEAFDELAPSGTLCRLGILERTDRDGTHERQATWTLARRVLGFLLESDPARCTPANLDELTLAETTRTAVRRAMQQPRAVVLASGLPRSGRRTMLAAASVKPTLEIAGHELTKDSDRLTVQLRGHALECRLSDRVPLIANLDALDEAQLALVGSELVAQLDGLVLATCGVNRPAIRWDRPAIIVEMGKPRTEQLATLWLKELGQGSEGDGELPATQYPLAPALVHHAATAAKACAVGEQLTPEDIYAGIRAVLDDRLGQFARRVTVTQTWDDLVLPQEQVDSIVELMARVRGRRKVYEAWGFGAKLGKGLGVTALFSGPPGTGKTMVAALIARDLGLELYQVDLGKVVSKWIGETEKNLAAMFDAAEAGHAVLLFDEADALFGKRTDVKSSNDRHANLETNYLLQRLETFSGICLLTSNHESHIDPAFQRRLSLHLRFELPEVEERAQLWRAVIPKAAPLTEGIDFATLARRYAMSGGYIRNAALRAAFLAADADEAISMAHLDHAARIEYAGMGKLAS